MHAIHTDGERIRAANERAILRTRVHTHAQTPTASTENETGALIARTPVKRAQNLVMIRLPLFLRHHLPHRLKTPLVHGVSGNRHHGETHRQSDDDAPQVEME